MRKKFSYSFSKDGTFICKSLENNIEIQNKKAIESLKMLDTISFDKIKVYKSFVLLYKDDVIIEIKDLKLLSKYKYDQYIPNLYNKIRVALKEYIKKEAFKKIKTNIRMETFKVAMGAMLFLTIIPSQALEAGQPEPIRIQSEPLELDEEIMQMEIPDVESINEETIETEIVDEVLTSEPEQEVQEINQIIEEVAPQEQISPIINEPEYNQDLPSVYLNFELTKDHVKKQYAFSEFEEQARWCSEKWGISENLILMLLTQESAGKEINLMQIEWDAWAEQPIKAYNFRDGKHESFVLTENPSLYDDKNIMCITKKDLENPKTNISIGCVLLRKSAEAMHYHIMAALQCYNLGIGNMEKVFNKTLEQTGQTKEEILQNQSNISFYKYTYVPKKGDPQYLSHVFSFIDEYGETIAFKHLQNGEVVEEKINVYEAKQI